MLVIERLAGFSPDVNLRNEYYTGIHPEIARGPKQGLQSKYKNNLYPSK